MSLDEGQDVGKTREAIDLDAELRHARMEPMAEVLIPFMAAISGAMAAFQIYTYLTTRMWQSLVVAGGALACLALIGAARWALRYGSVAARAGRGAARNARRMAGYLLIGTVYVLYGSGELGFSGSTLVLGVGGALALLLVTALFFARRWRVWLAATVVYAAILVTLNHLEPIPRFDAASTSTLAVHLMLAALVCAFFGVWFLLRSMSGAGSIGSRLLVSFVSLVLLPVVVVGAATVVGGLRSDTQQVTNQLESVAILKEAEIQTWVDDLHSDLALALAGGEVVPRVLELLEEPADAEAVQEAEAAVRVRFEHTIAATPRYEELLLIDRDGRVVLSTDPLHEGDARGSQAYFRQGLRGETLQPPRYSPTTMSTSVFVARPVLNDDGEARGVLVGRASLERLNEIMIERTGLGETGDTYLVGATRTLLTPRLTGRVNVFLFSEGIDAAVGHQANGSGVYTNNEGVWVVGAYRWLPELQVALIAEQHRAEAFRESYVTLGVLAGVALLSAALAVAASLLITRSIAAPLAALAHNATRIATGELRRVSEERKLFDTREDEVGTLARAFYSMMDQLQDLIGGLEDRVDERTQELERRSGYLEAAAEVGRAASSILDADVLTQQVVEVIREEFDLYYVGLFVLDEGREWATLTAATGEGGKAMLERRHRLRVGGESMIGWSLAHGEARVAQQATEDAVRLATPELPETRSEVALPLRSRGETIGALSVQHREPDAFDPDSLVVLQTMADQVAVALDNAQLFAERQEALDIAHRAYGELSGEAWAEILRTRADFGFRSEEHRTVPESAALRADAERALQLGQTISGAARGIDGRHTLAVPIRVRGQVVGVIDTYKPAEAGEWTAEEIAFLERIASELDPALESARLYQDTQQRAAREHAIRRVTDRMRRSVEIEAILESTIVELARALGAPRAFIRLGTDDARGYSGDARVPSGGGGGYSEGDGKDGNGDEVQR